LENGIKELKEKMNKTEPNSDLPTTSSAQNGTAETNGTQAHVVQADEQASIHFKL
jgi:hypothetical protein